MRCRDLKVAMFPVAVRLRSDSRQVPSFSSDSLPHSDPWIGSVQIITVLYAASRLALGE